MRIVIASLATILVAACQPAPAGQEPPAADAPEATTPASPAPDTTPTADLPEACRSGDLGTPGFAGAWRVDNGEARFGAITTTEGPDGITLRESGGGLTMTIDGFPTVRLQRLAANQPAWSWPTGPDVAVTPNDILLVYGCADQSGMARFTGQARVTVDGMSALATFRLMLTGSDEGVLHWEMGAPMSSAGLFSISRTP